MTRIDARRTKATGIPLCQRCEKYRLFRADSHACVSGLGVLRTHAYAHARIYPDSAFRMIVSRDTHSCVCRPREEKTSFIESSFNFTTRRSARRKREGSINRKLHRGSNRFGVWRTSGRSPPVKYPRLWLSGSLDVCSGPWFAEYSITYAAALRRLRYSYVKQSVRQ